MSNFTTPGDEAPNIPCCGAEFWMYVGICAFLVLFAAIMSGLTISLMSLDPMNLSIIMESGTSSEKRYAAAIAPLIENRHLLLVTLLLGNAVAAEALPIYMDMICDTHLAIILSVTLVLGCSEIIPQALFTKYKLMLGAKFAGLVQTLMILFCFLSWPIGKLLDHVLGDDHAMIYRRAELKELTAQHLMDEDGHGTLTKDEVRILNGTLDMAGKQAKDAMRPLKDVYMIEASSPLDRTTLRNIMATGFSRIPVYHNDVQNVIGMLLVKDLLLVNPDDAVSVAWSERGLVRGIRRVPESLPLFDLLHLFRKGTSRLALVCREKQEGKGSDDGCITGIVTLEDVIEELIQEEILDETDQGVDVVAMLAHQFAQKQLREQTRTGRSKTEKQIRASRNDRIRREMSDSGIGSDVWKPIALASLMKTRHGDHSHLRPIDHASSASPVVGARYLPHEMSKPPHRRQDDL
mmetsp:Transcript_26968/g.88177  ORF Transcript_26968/g.88177 Transcript_26968/m.88177 type:complete len:463 (-) Transcript_26968:106-1494(-)